MLKDSSWDFGVVFYDTTASYFSISGQDTPEDDIYHPEKFEMLAAYPNPFNASVSLPFIVAHDSQVRIEIVNLLGQVVAELANRNFAAGKHTLNWQGQSDNGSVVTSGIYFCRMTTNFLAQSRKIILLK
jgi:hypothetical protein